MDKQYNKLYALVKESLDGSLNQCMVENIARTVTVHLVRNDVEVMDVGV